jgi:hypothetical protein
MEIWSVKEGSHESCQIVGIRWAVGVRRCTGAHDCPRRDLGQDQEYGRHLDLVKASGTAKQILPIDLPWIPGHEFSGIVEQVGSDVAAYTPGDVVFAANETGGAYAEYLAVKPTLIAKKPSNESYNTEPQTEGD